MSNNKGLEIFGAIMLIILIIPISVILNGFVLSKIWNWFMPYIGVVEITTPVAIGLSCIPGLFRNRNVTEKELKIKGALFQIIGAPLFLLFFAYIVTLFL